MQPMIALFLVVSYVAVGALAALACRAAWPHLVDLHEGSWDAEIFLVAWPVMVASLLGYSAYGAAVRLRERARARRRRRDLRATIPPCRTVRR